MPPETGASIYAAKKMVGEHVKCGVLQLFKRGEVTMEAPVSPKIRFDRAAVLTGSTVLSTGYLREGKVNIHTVLTTTYLSNTFI